MKKHRASIIITVLILMVVSSFLVLVTMRYFFSMLTGYNSLTNYYKAYYLARGNMDMLITQHAYRGRGYETAFSGGGTDFGCTAFGCKVSGTIISHFPRIDTSIEPTDNVCSPTNAIYLGVGQSAIFPLFTDPYQGQLNFVAIKTGDYQSLVAGSIKDIDVYIYASGQVATGNIYIYDSLDGVFGQIKDTMPISDIPLSSNGLIQQQKKEIISSNISNINGLFIIISNPQNAPTPFTFCFSQPMTNKKIPMIGLTSIIRADAQVNDAFVTLETLKTNRFPSILLQ